MEPFASLELEAVPDFMARSDLDGVIQSAVACRLPAMTGHVGRSVASTGPVKPGFDDAIELQLAQAPANKVRGTYDKAKHLPARRVFMQDFADWLMPEAGQPSPA